MQQYLTGVKSSAVSVLAPLRTLSCAPASYPTTEAGFSNTTVKHFLHVQNFAYRNCQCQRGFNFFIVNVDFLHTE